VIDANSFSKEKAESLGSLVLLISVPSTLGIRCPDKLLAWFVPILNLFISLDAKCPIIIDTIGLLSKLFLFVLPPPNNDNTFWTPPPATRLRKPDATVLVASATTSLLY
jgi:hypothetical protein